MTGGGCAPDDRAVSDVLGSILLVAITVTMMVGLSLAVLSIDGPRDRLHADIRTSILPGADGWGSGDETVRMEHVGGESMPQARARIQLTVAGAMLDLRADDLDQGFADGVFGLGDTWQRTQVIHDGDLVEMLLIDVAGNAVITATRLTAGSAGTDGGAGAAAGAADAGGLLGDDGRAVLRPEGAAVHATGCYAPASQGTIGSVTIGMPGWGGSVTGPGSTVMLCDHVGRVAGAAYGSHAVASLDADTGCMAGSVRIDHTGSDIA